MGLASGYSLDMRRSQEGNLAMQAAPWHEFSNQQYKILGQWRTFPCSYAHLPPYVAHSPSVQPAREWRYPPILPKSALVL